jgi:hypothetical protein
MTKDRVRKQAARQRAARTGERYVVAQRATVEAEPSPDSWLHEATHRVRGVTAHVDGGLQSQARASRRRGRVHENVNPTSSNRAHRNYPRVLVAWQNWIANRLGAGDK